MYALTLWQPWAHFVVRGEKLIENRPWEPPASIWGRRFAIHAGKRWDGDRAKLIFDLAGREVLRNECAFGAVIGTVELVNIVASTNEAEEACPGHGKWFFGPFGWVLKDAQLCDPIPCRGYQKLWNLPKEIEEQLT